MQEARGAASAGGRATLYWSKNATEPHAIEENYRYKWTRASLERAEEEAESRVPLPPSPPREHQPAIITRRNGQEVRRQTPLYSAEDFAADTIVFDCACRECFGDVPPWIARANTTWVRSHEASA